MEKEIYIPRHLKKKTFEVENKSIQKKPSRKKRAPWIICPVLAAVVLSGIWIRGSLQAKDTEHDNSVLAERMPEGYRDTWLKNKALNSDYVGEIVFDSGLISLPFVQAEDVYDKEGNPYVFYSPEGEVIDDVEEYTGNDVYIWKNWKTGSYDRYEEGGSVFMDYRNSLDDQNLIIYGHHFARDYDSTGEKQFTPLDLLLKEENYEKNRTLKLVLEQEIRTYEICAVLIIDAKDEKQLQIARPYLSFDLSLEYDPGFFEEYLALIDRLALYPTGIQISEHDRLLTLITCIEHQPDLRQAVICRQTGVEKYDTETNDT